MDLDLRPLSLGEILDRAFSMYRRHWLLFVGISAVPQILSFAFAVLGPQAATTTAGTVNFDLAAALNQLLFTVVYLVVLAFVLLFTQGGTTVAVSELYLGRAISIAEALRRVGKDIFRLFGVLILYFLVIFCGFILLIIPGIYWLCRLLVCYPVAIIERPGPGKSISRTFSLTKGFAGRAFAIVVMSIVLTLAAQALFSLPFRIPLGAAANDPGALRFWQILEAFGRAVGGALVAPIPLIANSIFYYDLRVRKEAFDLQLMMNPETQRPVGSDGTPSLAS